MQNFEKKDFENLKSTIDGFAQKYGVSLSEIINLFGEVDALPISIFNDKLSPMETITKFLHENKNLRYSEIAHVLNKKISAVWISYRNAKKKCPKKFSLTISQYDIPIERLRSGKLSLLELITSYLKDEHKLGFREIGRLLHRDERTIWTTYKRALSKNG